MRNLPVRGFTIAVMLCFLSSKPLHAQFLMDMIDTTKDLGRGMLNVYKRLDHLRISGYMQPQFQFASDTGVSSFSGGNFAAGSSNRFTLRRGRVRFDYARFSKDSFPAIQFVFQFDGTERGVAIRDFWGRVFDNKWHLFSLTTGMFARPFGYELNLSSGDREAPERGRMSQTLMKTERDLGAMISYEQQRKDHPLHNLKIEGGFFNGQGLISSFDYDSYKDFIGQIYLKPTKIATHFFVSGGVSVLTGGLKQTGRYRYETVEKTDKATVIADSAYKPGSRMPRQYEGINAQLKWKHKWGTTELRAEYWQGIQTGSKSNSETPSVATYGENQYVRHFNGVFITFLQNIVNDKNQLVVKYDFYDPNTRVKGMQLGVANSNFTAGDIKYSTLGFGGVHYFNPNLKLVLFYEVVKNETTSLVAFSKDISDNVFTCRMQFRF